MPPHPGQANGFDRISDTIDIEEKLETLEDGIDLAARLMVTFIDPDNGDGDDLEATARDLSIATSETPPDIEKIHELLKHALTECLDRGWLVGDTEDRPCHLTRLMLQAISDGDRLREFEESYHAALHTMADAATQESESQGT
ncbi:hypothetical protein [Pseudoponticoccus marisrubri]|uniref:Uncharacterized protein n=1 Tax=Pseudoponticoccus marisrubri TaxID=1685382 RepID=A0A0W7WLC8_9RHOB|nr:hypothetical protein [Pseudoponticoccus marisrubri]KUF11335.1 hypothetical protein AVJ23_06070 [Pseudoponticoccus marisrubri]